MLLDCHAHFEPRMLDLEPMLAKMREAKVERVVLIPAMNDPLPETPERLLSAMRAAMRSRYTRPLAELVHRATLTRDGRLRLGSKSYALYARPDNASVARAVAAHPERFWGWIFLNPRGNPGVLEELERWRQEPGMIGLKVHPHWHDYEVRELFPLLARAEELGLPVLAHLGFGRRGDARALCYRFPKLKLVSAHAGFPFFSDLWRLKDECPNLCVDLSSPYLDERLARDAVAAMGPRRCLYGTDAPYGFHAPDGTYDYGALRGWVERMPLSSADAENVFAGNFLRILGRG